MKRQPMVRSLHHVSEAEAADYLEAAGGDEIAAAYELACDRNCLDDCFDEPDATDVHHALFLLRRAQGLEAPSYDSTKLLLRQRDAA